MNKNMPRNQKPGNRPQMKKDTGKGRPAAILKS
jgi:hypothetical protein